MIWFDNYGQEYDCLVYELGEEEAFARYSQQKDKYIVVEVRDDGDTRLFIRSLFSTENAERKNGWWNTFTICEQPQKAGIYIAKITNVRKDKKGYPNFVAMPIIQIDFAGIVHAEDMWTKSKRQSALWALFLESALFTEHAEAWISGMGLNMSALKAEFGMVTSQYTYTDVCARAVGDAIYHGTDLKTFIDLLLSPTQEQLGRQRKLEKLRDFFDNRAAHADEYPNLVKKLNRMAELNGEFSVRYDIVHIMDDFDLKYEQEAYYNKTFEAINGGIFDRAEAYLKFDAERKAANSKKRGAAKKAKKAAAKKAAEEAKANNA